MPKFEHHIFICTNTREDGHPRGSCNPGGTNNLQKLFNEALKKYDLKGKVRANKAGCLDQCEHGPNVVIYPDNAWYGFVKESDVDSIVSAMAQGRHAPENVLPDTCLNTTACPHRKSTSA